MDRHHVIIIGAGIVGVSCAHQLIQRGSRVTLIEAGPGPGVQGATAAGMGHIVVNDGDPDILKLCLRGREMWRQLLDENVGDRGYWNTGTLWLAEDEEQLHSLEGARDRLHSAGVDSHTIQASELFDLEPALNRDLAGGLRIPHDGVVYAPKVTARLLSQTTEVESRFGTRVTRVGDGLVTLEDGTEMKADAVVIASGIFLLDNLAGEEDSPWKQNLKILPREGHLAITARGTGILRHHVVEAGYQKGAHGVVEEAVACAILPRPTDQLCLGSSRRPGRAGAVDPGVLKKVIDRCERFVPGVRRLPILRSWTGARAATMDGKPLIGPVPGWNRTWLVGGFEGLGITQAPAAAELLAQRIHAETCTLDTGPWDPGRMPALSAGGRSD